jgi:hypothetical protein
MWFEQFGVRVIHHEFAFEVLLTPSQPFMSQLLYLIGNFFTYPCVMFTTVLCATMRTSHTRFKASKLGLTSGASIYAIIMQLF